MAIDPYGFMQGDVSNTTNVHFTPQPLGAIATPVPTDTIPNGPGGNTIVPTPATPNEWWKMLIAIGIGASGIWMVSLFGDEDSAKWVAFFVLLGIITYYETHGNKQFSSGINDLLGSIK